MDDGPHVALHSSGWYSNLEDEDVVEMARVGDRQASECLLSRYRALIEIRARKFYLQGADREDVIQEGYIGLWEAIRDFERKQSRFRPFAVMCVNRQLISAVKAAARHKHSPLNASISFSSDSGEQEFDPAHEDSNFRGIEVQPSVKCKLSPLESSVLNGFLQGKTYLELSQELHCRTKSIDNALQRLKKKLGSPKAS
jgi:RNA polymerase sporulation-specific sigma factor